MDELEARDLAGLARVARLATVRPDGSPHLVPITFALEGDMIVFAVDDKPKHTRRLQRLANMAADPRVSVLFDRYHDDWSRLWWVRADGTATILQDGPAFERAISWLGHRYETYRHHPPAGPVVEIRIHHWSWWSP